MIKGDLRLNRNLTVHPAQVVSHVESECESMLHGAYGEGGNTMYSSASYTQDDNNLQHFLKLRGSVCKYIVIYKMVKHTGLPFKK